MELSAVVFSSEDAVSFLNTVLPFQSLGIPVVVVGNDQKALTAAFRFKTYEGGKTFGRKLIAGLRKVTTKYVVFSSPGVFLTQQDFYSEALEYLETPDVGLVVPSIPKNSGPQSYRKKNPGSLVRITPWFFVARTQELLQILDAEVKKIQDERLIQLVCLAYLRQGRFCYVLPKYTLEVEKELQDPKVTSLDLKTKPLTPLLLYQYRKDATPPERARALFKNIISYKIFETPQLSSNNLVFLLKEGEDFASNFTPGQIQRMCLNADPFVFAYQFPIFRSWKDGWYYKDQTKWSVRAFVSYQNVGQRMLVNPYYAQQIPYEALRPVNAPIIKRNEEELTSGLVGPIRTPSLTIATIMRNEMKHLTTYLSAAAPFAQEVVLVDTGSTDGSAEFAEAFGCKVIKAELKDNFAEVRNLYLKQATGTWLLQQDLDEVVDYKQIHAVLSEVSPNVDAVQFSVHNLTPKEGVIIYQDAIRLLREPRSWYYHNRIHETVEKCAAEMDKKVTRVQEVVIYHLGFLSPNMHQKLETYRKLTLKQMEEEPDNPLPYFNLALDYLNELEKEPENLDIAIKLLQKTVSLHPTFALAQYELSRVYCQKALNAIGKVLELIQPNHPMVGAIKKIYQPLIEYTQRYIVE